MEFSVFIAQACEEVDITLTSARALQDLVNVGFREFTRAQARTHTRTRTQTYMHGPQKKTFGHPTANTHAANTPSGNRKTEFKQTNDRSHSG